MAKPIILILTLVYLAVYLAFLLVTTFLAAGKECVPYGGYCLYTEADIPGDYDDDDEADKKIKEAVRRFKELSKATANDTMGNATIGNDTYVPDICRVWNHTERLLFQRPFRWVSRREMENGDSIFNNLSDINMRDVWGGGGRDKGKDDEDAPDVDEGDEDEDDEDAPDVDEGDEDEDDEDD